MAGRDVNLTSKCIFGTLQRDESLIAERHANLRSLSVLYADCTALECVTQAAAAVARLCRILLARHGEFKALVASKKASTSQRRSFLTQTALLPGMVSFLRSVMLMLESFTARASTPVGVKFVTSCMGVIGKIESEVDKQGLAAAIKAAAQFIATKAVKAFQNSLKQQEI